MAEVQENVTFNLRVKDALSGTMAAINAALNKTGNTLSSLNRIGSGSGATGTVSRLLFGIGGSFLVVEGLRKSLDLARQFETNQAKLNISIDGNISRFKQLQTVIASISKSGVFSQSDLTATAQSLVERGVPDDQIAKTLQVVANTASALRIPLDEAAQQIAQTFGGVLPRSLSRAVPQIKQLSEEALRAGGAVDVLMKAFDGRDAAFAATAPGQEAAQLRDIEQAWTDIGRQLLPIKREILPKIASGMKAINDLASEPHAAFQGIQLTLDTWRDRLHSLTGDPLLGVGTAEADDRDKFAKDNAAAKQVADQKALADEALDARKRGQEASTEIDQLGTDRHIELSKKAAEESEKLAAEEFRAKSLYLEAYLKKIDEASTPDQKRLAESIKTSSYNVGSFQATAQDLIAKKDRLTYGAAPIDESGVQQRTEAINKLQIQIAEAIENQLSATKDLERAQDSLHDSIRKQLDDRIKATQEATKSLPASAKDGKTSAENGVESADQLQDDLAKQIQQITTSLPETFSLIDHLYSTSDAAELKKRLSDSFADAKIQAKRTADSVTPIIGDLMAIGTEARKAAISDAANEFTEFEFKAKSAKDALNGFLESFLKTIASMVNQRLFTGIANGLFGPTDSQGNSTGSGLVQNVGGAVLKGIFSAFSSGGYTGDGHPSQVAGIVHRGEQVIPADLVSRYGLANLTPNAIGAMLAGSSSRTYFSSRSLSVPMQGGGSSRAIVDAVNNLAEIHRTPITVAVPVTGSLIDQIHNHPDSPRILAQMMTQNSAIFTPAIRRLKV